MSDEYEIRVHILEARNLQPRDDNGTSDPICIVKCGDEKFHTDKFEDVLSCTFDRWFVFHKKGDMDQVVNIAVYDANTILRDEIIGSFDLDVGFVYGQEGHEIFGRWLALMDPKRKHPGVQGYLKVSAIVLAGGDDPVDHESGEEWEDAATGDSLQSMVLLPPEIENRECQLSVKVYRATDLIKMDLDGKCDPYVKISFGGSTIQSSVKENKLDPEWNQELLIPFSLPIMATKILVEVMDEDLGSADDTVSSFFLSLDAVTNGEWTEPKWIPMYAEGDDLSKAGSGSDQNKIARGSILIAADVYNNDNPVRECRPCAPKNGGAVVNYSLRVDVYELIDIPFSGKIRLTVRPGNKVSTKSKNHSLKHHNCSFRQQLEETTYQFPTDKTQIPDIFVSIYHVELLETQRFGYIRLNPHDLEVDRPVWYEIIPDSLGSAQLKGELPGYILLNAIFGMSNTLPKRGPLMEYQKIPYQLRAHIYQAKNLAPKDKTGDNDPFCTVQVGPFKGKTRIIENTNFPQWYETIILDLEIPHIIEHAPYIVFKIFDEDKWPDTKDFIGKVSIRPEDIKEQFTKPTWYELDGDANTNGSSGFVLLSVQLIPGDKINQYPEVNIHPETKTCISELGLLSLHDMQLVNGMQINNPSLRIMYGDSPDKAFTTEKVNAKHGNAPIYQSIIQEIEVPVDPIYASSLNLTLNGKVFLKRLDCGVADIDLTSYYPWIYHEDAEGNIELLSSSEESSEDLELDISAQVAQLESELVDLEESYDEELILLEDDNLLTDFHSTSEAIANLDDRTNPLPEDCELDHPFIEEPEEEEKRPRLKKPLETKYSSPFTEIAFKREKSTKSVLSDQAFLKSTFNFALKDTYQRSDPVDVKYAPQEVVVRCYILRGKAFVPQDEDGLCDAYISLKCGDYEYTDKKVHNDTLTPNFFTMYEFTTILPGGDTSLDITVYDEDKGADTIVGVTSIELSDRWFSPQWQNMRLKPIELRGLFIPTSRIPQGKLEMWVDIMTPKEAKKNPPEDISPPQPERWQVRSIIWNVADVEVNDTIDLFVTGKLGDHKHQLTDTHWSSPDGCGEFNWRMIWDIVIPSRKETRLLVQVWDKNIVSTNEALAECTLNLTNILKNAYRTKEIVNIDRQFVHLTLPYKNGTTGSVELDVEIVPYDYAMNHPVGKGRDGLPDVHRPPPPWDIASKFSFLGKKMKRYMTIAGIVLAVLVIGGIILGIIL